jgi:hypothetical protein
VSWTTQGSPGHTDSGGLPPLTLFCLKILKLLIVRLFNESDLLDFFCFMVSPIFFIILGHDLVALKHGTSKKIITKLNPPVKTKK